MFDSRKTRPDLQVCYLALVLLALSVSAFSQDQDKDDDKDKKAEPVPKGYIKVEGKVRCGKPDPTYAIEVPDRPGHALTLNKRKCVWSEPLEIKGTKTKEGEAITFAEKMEGELHVHGFEVDTLDNGEKLTWQSMGLITPDKGAAKVKGRWSLMRGTGNIKAIKGGGSYAGNVDADGVMTLNFDGVYDPNEIVEQKK
jgi:hypothetical protein